MNAAELCGATDRVHAIVWERFVGPGGVLYEYVGPDGEVDLPTGEECAAGKPNALGRIAVQTVVSDSGLTEQFECRVARSWRVGTWDTQYREVRGRLTQ